MKLFCRVLSAIIAISLPTAVIVAQNTEVDSKIFQVKTNLLVLNEKNEYVSGVKGSDIKIFENGVEQKLASFAELDGTADISLVIDNTLSVRSQLEDMIGIGQLIVSNLRPTDSASVIRFVDKSKISIEQTWTNSKQDLFEALDNLFAESGGSAVIDALYLASDDLIKRHKVKNRRYAIVLISDAEDRSSYYSEKNLLKLLEGTPIQIFTITLTKELPKNQPSDGRKSVGAVVQFVHRLTSATGGTSFVFQQKSTVGDLKDAFKSLLVQLRSQYVFSYMAANVNKDTNLRKLTIKIADGPNGEKRNAIMQDTVILPYR